MGVLTGGSLGSIGVGGLAADGARGASDAMALTTAGAGVRNYMTALQYQNTSATASEIQVQYGATAIWRGQAPASMRKRR